jgi:SAM-dependent methyltransferase
MTTTESEHAGLDHILEHVDLSSMRGLEIGPLHNPVVSKGPGRSIAYVDHADTETLRRKYAAHDNVEFVFDVDYVWSDGRLAEAVGDAAPFDFVIASHVIEHVPDLVSWFDQLAEVLRPGGLVSLVIPDKRFCFDTRRRTTDVSEVVDSYLMRRRRPSVAQIFDFWARYATVDAGSMWAGSAVDAPDRGQVVEAYGRCVDAMSHDEYVDVHATTWTPSSFIDVLGTLFDLDLIRFRIAAFHPTPFNSLEFYATLERLDDSLAPAERRRLQLASMPEFVEVQPHADGRVWLDVSDREAKLLEMKRQILGVTRRAVRRVRRAVRPPRPQG